MPKSATEQPPGPGSHQFVLPRQINADENKAIASRVFVNWISQQSLTWADAGMVPARNEVREDPEFAEMGAVTEFAKELDYIRFVPPIPGVQRPASRNGTPPSARRCWARRRSPPRWLRAARRPTRSWPPTRRSTA